MEIADECTGLLGPLCVLWCGKGEMQILRRCVTSRIFAKPYKTFCFLMLEGYGQTFKWIEKINNTTISRLEGSE